MASLKVRLEDSVKPSALRAYLASRKIVPDAAGDSSTLVATAVAVAFSLAVAVYIAANISGGHVNPAVTFAMAVGGHISVPMAIFYWMSQLLASVIACFLLKMTTVSQHITTHGIPEEMTGFGASILEAIMTFTLVYTAYASSDPRRGPLGPIVIGFIAGANVLASGPFTGGSMNPAASFGSAIFAGSFKNQAVYWVGPLIGGALAGIFYDNVMFPLQVPETIDGVSV